MKNRTCPECGKKFHACYSCGLIHTYEQEYCSFECFQRSLKYIEIVNKLKGWLTTISNDVYKIRDFMKWVDNTDYVMDDLNLYWEDVLSE